MNKLINLFFLLIAFSGLSQEINLVQNYNIGQSYNYELVRGKEDTRYPSMEGIRTSTKVTMIFSKDNGGITNEISYGETVTFDAEGNKLEKNLSSTSDLFKGFSFKIKLDNKGKFVKVLNFPTLQKEFESYLFKMTKDPESFRELVFKTYKNEEAFLINYFPEIIYHFDIYGSDTTPILRTHFNQNPLGGDPIPMQLSLTIKDKIGNQLVLDGKETISEEKISNIIEKTITEISQKRGQEVDLSKIPKLTMENDVSFKYDLGLNILKEVSVIKISTSQGMTAKKYNILKLSN